MRLQLINANTSRKLTERMVARGRSRFANELEITGLTAKFGASYIASREASTVAARAVVELCHSVESGSVGPDAVILACFGDPGLWAARDILSVPVIGMAESSCHTACQLGRRFSIVTGGYAWIGMLHEFVAQIGLEDRLAGVVAADFTGADVAVDPGLYADRLLDLVSKTVKQDQADVVIMGGAGLMGIAELIAGRAPVPVLDSLDCALAQAQALASIGRVASGVGFRSD